MSQKKHKKQGKTAAPRPATAPKTPPSAAPGSPLEHTRAAVLDLIARGRCRDAVETAKEFHAREKTGDAESLLVDAYIARMTAMLDKDMAQDALALADLVAQRCPSHRARLDAIRRAAAARSGSLETLLAPLARPDIAAEEIAAIEGVLRGELADLDALARCAALPDGHPLRRGAALVRDAFTAVCLGPVSDAAVALEEIPRRSPLAPWKMLVRAIAHFYRGEDALCLKWAEAIPPNSRPAKLAPVLRAMLDGGQHGLRTEKQRILSRAVTGEFEMLRDVLDRFDNAPGRVPPSALSGLVQQALSESKRVWPEFAERLKQHFSVMMHAYEVPVEGALQMIGGPSRKDAYFWRLMARVEETDGYAAMACAYWDEFRHHAVHEKWFAPGGMEEAQLYLRMAGLLRQLEDEDGERDFAMRDFRENYRNLDSYYTGQPKEVRAAVAGRKLTADFLVHDTLYLRVCSADPAPEHFRQWLEHTEDILGKGKADSVALRWREACPEDVEPLLYLAEAAERRNALKKALGYLEAAERLDALNARVRRARLRLLVATAKRHAADRRPRLLEKDLAEIEALPQAAEGDRPAFVSGLRWAVAVLNGDAAADAHVAETCRRMGGDLAGRMIIGAVAEAGKLDFRDVPPPGELAAMVPDALVEAVGRAVALINDLELAITISREAGSALIAALSDGVLKCPAAHLLCIAETALINRDDTMAYVASGAGLALGGAFEARFLYLRGRSIGCCNQERFAECITAAGALARTQRDMRLVEEIVERMHKHGGYLFDMDGPRGLEDAFDMPRKDIDAVIAVEKSKRTLNTRVPAPGQSDFLPTGRTRGRRRADIFDFPEDDYDEDFEDFFDSEDDYCAESTGGAQMELFQDDPDAGFADGLLDGPIDSTTREFMKVLEEVITKHPDSSFLDDPEFLGSDPELAARMADAFARYSLAHGAPPTPEAITQMLLRMLSDEEQACRGGAKKKKRGNSRRRNR